jgi:hypothetical protein
MTKLRIFVGCCLLSAIPLFAQIPDSVSMPFEGQPITGIHVPVAVDGIGLPISIGKPVHSAEIQEAENVIREQILKMHPSYIPVNLDVALVYTEFVRTAGGVEVWFRFRRLLLTEEDSPGSAMDEANPLVQNQTEKQGVVGEAKRDQRLGWIGGYGTSFLGRRTASGLSIEPSFSFWMSQKHDVNQYAGFRARLSIVPGLSTSLTQLDCGPEADAYHSPFGSGELWNTSFAAGCTYRFRSRSFEAWKIGARYLLSHERVRFPDGFDHTYLENGFQADATREWELPSGFLRLAPWIDGAHSDSLNFNARLGSSFRAYREWFSGGSAGFVTDVSLNVGTSIGPLPISRMFTGGSVVEPALLQQPRETENYWSIGPFLRGYSLSELVLPPGTAIITRADTTFAGISTTISGPGMWKLVFDRNGPSYSKARAIADNLTVVSRARALSEYLAISDTEEEAQKRAAKRVDSIKRTVRNLIDHTKEFSVRPVAAYDYGVLVSRDGQRIRASSAGFGIREWFRNCFFEVLYMRNVRPENFPFAFRSSNLALRYSVNLPDILPRFSK